jgi:hypothetical protein
VTAVSGSSHCSRTSRDTYFRGFGGLTGLSFLGCELACLLFLAGLALPFLFRRPFLDGLGS